MYNDEGDEKTVILLGDFEDRNDNPTPTTHSPYQTLLSCADVSSDLMRLAHHGAYGRANKKALLLQINPEMITSSSGFRFHHPRCEIYEFFLEWLQNPEPDYPDSKLLSTPSHWYTCGDAAQHNYRSLMISEAIYTTSECEVTDESTLVNYIYRFSIEKEGAWQVTRWPFNYYTEDGAPSGFTFPCK